MGTTDAGSTAAFRCQRIQMAAILISRQKAVDPDRPTACHLFKLDSKNGILDLAAKLLKIYRHFAAQGKITSIKALNLLNRSPSILGQIEDVHLSV